ncbi:MAG TPA: cytochrome C [Bdellovibrionales bacterium]|nr:MAG: hypothetical protein A2Z97_03740 [Bdellovibrionales bacterium GWB1_52_6]OFZ06369.1 MAG: hypothetical protein A2X97_02805 [Bdellovibrionales bacterium GWA1_52_35]OFZ38283.1 MAG: hypothetical protein A2070_13380 [Bdellovibrionales bacterium GWC1_52_8]HAR41650.1 cytochrome C [Bdellovibrionales bacterium]HCM40122.1 cytochrome C [Bdellovibrionales bacterium]
MQFAIFQFPYLGNGMIIGLNAVIHVLLSHGFAIGVFAMLTLSEWLSNGSPEHERFNRSLLRISVIAVTAFGSITGAGIWFTIGALTPEGTASMLRVFFWPWFIEWVVFVLEAGTLLYIFFFWDHWTGPRRVRRFIWLGVYAILAILSAVLITGILGFMLTPGAWPETLRFSDAFFNPTFLPQLVSRFGIAFSLGALISIVILLFKKHESALQKPLLRVLGVALGTSLLLFAGGIGAYWPRIPIRFRDYTHFSILTGQYSQHAVALKIFHEAGLLSLLLLIGFAVAKLLKPTKILSLVCLLFIMILTAEFERVREFIRGPYLMPGYMYANGITVAEHLIFREKGMLPTLNPPLKNREQQGAYLFARNCGVCHSVNGINDIRDRVRGRPKDGIQVIIGRTHEMLPFMPPFSGSEPEKELLADYLYRLTGGTP